MANVKIVGDAVVLTSALSFEDIKLVEKIAPKELTLFEEENGRKVPVFGVCTTKSHGRITKDGVSFAKGSRDGGFAEITMGVPECDGDVKEVVAELIGTAVIKLNELEAKLPEVIAGINAQKQAMLDCIEVC